MRVVSRCVQVQMAVKTFFESQFKCYPERNWHGALGRWSLTVYFKKIVWRQIEHTVDNERFVGAHVQFDSGMVAR